MNAFSVLLLLSALSTVVIDQVPSALQSRPLVVPWVNSSGDGPAFVVECINNSGAELSSRDGDWLESLRVNGEVLTEQLVNISFGGSTPIPSGQLWKGVVVLLQTETGRSPAERVGEVVRHSRVVPLSNGKHTFAVRCRENWSDDVPFYWSRFLPTDQR